MDEHMDSMTQEEFDDLKLAYQEAIPVSYTHLRAHETR